MVLSIADFFRRMHRKEEGFTLIELLIVIAILAVLAAIAIPLVVNRIDEAKESADIANVAQLQSAVDLYMLDYGAGKDGLDEPLVKDMEGWQGILEEKGYLQKVIEDHPLGGTYDLDSKNGNIIVVSTHPSDEG